MFVLRGIGADISSRMKQMRRLPCINRNSVLDNYKYSYPVPKV